MDSYSILDQTTSGGTRGVPPPVSPPAEDSIALPRITPGDVGKSLTEMAERDLEAALQLLAERAQYITGASGTAIALLEGDEMICRASAGPSAPALGTQVQMKSGLTGESVRTRQVLRCDDAETDSRVNRESCRALATEIRIRAERICGACLAAVPKAQGKRAGPTKKQALTEVGITWHKAALWERLAALNGDDFERALNNTLNHARQGGTKTLIRTARSTTATPPAMTPALQVTARLRAFDHDLVPQDAAEVAARMTPAMRAAVCEIAPRVCAWLAQLAELAAQHHEPNLKVQVVQESKAAP